MINDDKKTKKVHSSWNFDNFDIKHKIHLGSLKKINTNKAKQKKIGKKE